MRQKPWRPFEDRASAFLNAHDLKITVPLAKQFYDEEARQAQDGDMISTSFIEYMQTTGAQKVLEDVRGRLKFYWVKLTGGMHVKRRGIRALRKYDADGGAYYQPSFIEQMTLFDFRVFVADELRRLEHDKAYCQVLIRVNDTTAKDPPSMIVHAALLQKGFSLEAMLKNEQ